MAIDVQWSDEQKTVLHWKFEGSWSWEEYHAVNDQSVALRAETQGTIVYLVDMSESKLFPEHVLGNLRTIGNTMQGHNDLTIVIANNVLVKAMSRIFRAMFPQINETLVIVETMEQAQAIIAKRQAASK
jgi:hypothetical protein